MTAIEWVALGLYVAFAVWSLRRADRIIDAAPGACICGYEVEPGVFDGDCRSLGCDPECPRC